MLYENKKNIMGDRILLHQNDTFTVKEYFVALKLVSGALLCTNQHFKFRQVVYSPEDPANPCTNYPNERFRSYDDCDEDFIRRSLPNGLGIY